MKITKNVTTYLLVLFLTLSISTNRSLAAKSMSTMACTSISQNIYSGSKGNEVKKLQTFLFEKGYLIAMPKANKFGQSTVSAVKKFQAENNLIVTGNIGQVSRDKIKEMSCGKAITKTTVINLNDSNLATSSGPNVKFNGVIEIDDKMTFTQDQLAKFKADLIVVRLKYIDKNTDIEPLKTEIGKEVESVFFKNLGIDKVFTKNIGILFYPEIANILGQIKKEYPDQSKAMAPLTTTSNNSIVLSNVNPSSVSISEIDKYTNTPLTFKVTNDILVKNMCRREYMLDNKGAEIFDPSMYCDGYIAKNGIYSDGGFFVNFKTSISGTYDTRNGKNYFENEGIYSKVIDFYAKDKDGAESNHIRFTFTR